MLLRPDHVKKLITKLELCSNQTRPDHVKKLITNLELCSNQTSLMAKIIYATYESFNKRNTRFVSFKQFHN